MRAAQGARIGRVMMALGGALAVPAIVAACLAPALAPYGPLDAPGPTGRPLAPSAAHWLGTDPLGRDVLSLVLHGIRASLTLGLLAGLASLGAGTLIGLVAGTSRPAVDTSLMRLTDVALALPSVLVAIALAAVLEPGLGTLILAVAALGWTTAARLVRQETRGLVSREDHVAARALGAGRLHIARVHLLPALGPLLATLAALAIANALLLESGLSFLGLGVPPPGPSLGRMLAEGAAFQRSAPWLLVFPGVAILLLVLAPSLLAQGMMARRGPGGHAT